MDHAYQRFLSTSDLESWSASLDVYRDVFAPATDLVAVRPADIRRALTLSLYVAWLAARCGDWAGRDRALRGLDELGARLAGQPTLEGTEGAMIRAIIAAAKGYNGTAWRLVAELSPLPVEILLLTVPDRALRKAKLLEPYVRAGKPCFVPALYFYGSALLDLGYQHATKNLLEQHPEAASSALLIDLRGQLLELAGSWGEARDQYKASNWISHAYRHAVCDLILGAPVERLAQAPTEEIARFVAGMSDFSGETDRAGVLRSESFIRACRWSGFDSWLVQFELGRVSFQRRRHAEAERYLSAASRSAPAAFRFPIQDLRFTNLGWLGTAMEIQTIPEAIHVGEQALQEPGKDDARASIRLWIAETIRDLAPNDPLLTSSNHFLRGRAQKLRGNIPDAIAAWCSEIADRHTPRAFHELIRVFASYGFEQTASRLAETAALESEDSFFELSELAGVLADTIAFHVPVRVDGARLGAVLAAVESRMEAIVEAEFQHAIRAFHHFAARKRLEPLQRMLARAETLAEGPEELLQLAIARRRVGVGAGDPAALDFLHAAQRQSTARLERLLIARELAHFGDLSNARRVLNEERVLSDPRGLTAIEYVLALGTAAACAEDDHRRQLEACAVAALKEDLESGRFASSRDLCVERLNGCVAGAPLELAFERKASRTDGEASEYAELVAELKRLNASRSIEHELGVLNKQVEAMSGQGSPSARFALLGLHLERLDTYKKKIDWLRPVVADDELPLDRDLSPIRPRAKRLAALWRAYFQADSEGAAQRLEEIRSFHAVDCALAARWDRLRSAEAAAPTRFAIGCARQAAVLLRQISEGEHLVLWPSFLDVGSAVTADANVLTARMQAHESSLRERLAP